MSTLLIIPETGSWLGHPILRYACSCGDFATDARFAEDQETLKREMHRHWIACHLDELDAMGLGPCASCGQLTDNLKISDPFGDGRRVYLCQVHAPAQRLKALFGGQP